MTMDLFDFRPARSPLLVSIPHAGLYVPPAISARMTPAGHALPDTDWHVDRLYRFLDDDIGTLVANWSRYVVDLNRSPKGQPLYPGRLDTRLCPIETFAGDAIYREGLAPTVSEIERRCRDCWEPYHRRLAAEIDRLRKAHGFAILWDAHSIRSRVPRLFAGQLPELNVGTHDMQSCDAQLATRLDDRLADSGYSYVSNGRFTGGYITRHYGAPSAGVHAIQMEISQRCYMKNDETEFCVERADRLSGTLAGLFDILRSFSPPA